MSIPFNAATYLVARQVENGAGERIAVRTPQQQRSWTYAQVAEEVAAVAAGLRTIGVRPEERVLFVMVDGIELLTGILGAMRLGAVAAPVSTMLTGAELSTVVRDSRARCLVASPAFAAAVSAAVRVAPDLTDVVLAGDGDLEVRRSVRLHAWSDLVDAGRAQPPSAPETWEDSPALWLYTSGTTGKPKAAMHRHASFRHVAETYGAQVLDIGPGDVCFSVAKLFFAYGLGNSLTFPFSVGATTVLDAARPTQATVTERLLADRPTLFFAVPTFYAALLAADVPPEAFASVRTAVSAGEALPAQLYQRFTDRFGVEIIDGIGTTEALHIFLSNRSGAVRPGTTGQPVPGYEVQLRAEDGSVVRPGEPGALHVRGPSLATGYWCRYDLNQRVFQGEWLRTGDTFVASNDGYYTCLGRSDDLLKVGGMWVSPAEVEARLLQHPAVGQVAVVGLKDENGLDKPVAVVIPASGAAVDEAELIGFCREGLAAFKRPRHVLVTDAFPTTATGKLQRFLIRKLAADRLAAAVSGSPPPAQHRTATTTAP
jgi:benzoate-CoA ligase family protein